MKNYYYYYNYCTLIPFFLLQLIVIVESRFEDAFRMPRMPDFPSLKLPKQLDQSHIHHFGGLHFQAKHHSQYTAPPQTSIQSADPDPQFSPPFTGTNTASIPTDSQVDLIVDWLSKVGFTIDIFLRMQLMYPEGSVEQRNLIKNVYPPLRVLLEAQYAHEFKNGQINNNNNNNK